jgi:hypothetical protein
VDVAVAESPFRTTEVCSEPVDDPAADDAVGELTKALVAPGVVLPRGDPELGEGEGKEVLAAVGVEDDSPPSESEVDHSGNEGLDIVEAVKLESAI